jgi:arylsulfatase
MRSIKRPNVLIIYTDQQRWDSLKCYGNKLAVTPNLDRLASMGARLNNYFVQNPVCMPSRMSFLTGRYCSSLGIGTNGIPFPEDAVSVNQIIKPYGYKTAQIGKLHFQPHAKRDHKDIHPTYGFDTFILSDEPGCYDDAYTKWVEAIELDMLPKVRTTLPPAAYSYGKKEYSTVPRETHEPYIFEGEEEYTHSSFVASETCEFIKENKDQRFFAITGFYAPHTPVNPPKRFVDMYNKEEFDLPKIGQDESFKGILKDVPKVKWREIAAYYLALVSHVDDCVGKIINTLEEEGILENTLIIFTSDHGEYLGDHGRIQKGMPGHDCIIRVPCIISYPEKIEGGQVIEELVEAVDIVPTILDYCGIQTPTFVQGQSLKGLLDGEVNKHKDDILVEFFDSNTSHETTIRTERYKYYCSNSGKELLYDLEKDPQEFKNVEGDKNYAEILSDMRKRMIVRLQKAAYKNTNKTAEY